MTDNKPQESQEIQNNFNIQEQSNNFIINNNDINNNANNNINSNNNNKENKNGKNQDICSNKNISSFLINFSLKEKNKRLDELIVDLIYFKEQNKLNKDNKIGFKQVLFENLEKNLIELSFLTNKQLQEDRMQKLYIWYKNKIKSFEDLKNITAKSYKEVDEIDDLDVMLQKEEEKKLLMEEENIPQTDNTLEDLYKHRNKDMLFKDMLNDYKRKQINDPATLNVGDSKSKQVIPENENINIKNNEKIMNKTLSMTSFRSFSKGELSTFYSTKNGQNSFTLKRDLIKAPSYFEKPEGGVGERTFYSTFNKDNNLKFPQLNRETKFSYSFNRPPYNYYSMYVEKKIIKNKMENLREKRSAEEIDEKMDIYGYQKAKLKESIVNKYELRDIINMYANSNNFNSRLLEKYKYKPNTDKNESDNNNNITSQSKKSNINISKIKKEKILDPSRAMKRSQSCSYMNYSSLGEKQKMEINKVKNIDINTKSILEKNKEDIKVIKMKLKIPKEKLKSRLINIQQNNNNIPNDVVPDLVNKNSLFKEKLLNNNMCGVNFKKESRNIKEVDTGGDDSDSEYHNFYMSAYDFGNIKKIDNYRKTYNKFNYLTRNKNLKPRNENINNTFNLNKDNFLNFRKTMSSWKKNDFEQLCNKIIKNKENNNIKNNRGWNDEINKRKIGLKQRRQNSLLNAMVNPIEDSVYPQYFLPRSGSMLLKRLDQNAKKNKRNKKKK